MNPIADPPIVRMEAFDENGIHCGSAYLLFGSKGGWSIRIGGITVWGQTEAEARKLLKDNNARFIREES